MHEREAAELGRRCTYKLIDLDKLNLGAEALGELLVSAERMGFDGLNITHPCKQTVIAHLTGLSEEAHAIGAVNTIVLRDGQRIGHNTDTSAFASSFRAGLPGANLENVVLLGGGGGGRGRGPRALPSGCEAAYSFRYRKGTRRAPRGRAVRALRRGNSLRRNGSESDDGSRGRPGPRYSHGDDNASGPAHSGATAGARALGRRSRLLSAGNRTFEGREATRLPQLGWWPDGCSSGRGSIPTFHKHSARCRSNAASFSFNGRTLTIHGPQAPTV